MTNVMQKSGKPKILHKLGIVYVALGQQRFGCEPCYVHCPERMLKSRMLRTWIHKVGTCKLPYSP
jgi:hypothetical protein